MSSIQNRFVLAVVVLVSLAGAAQADSDVAIARDHFRRGNTLYDLRRFHEAAKEYEAAYELRNDAALLFDIGQAYRFAGEYDDAIGAYKAFLRRLPRTSNRAEVEGRIEELRQLIAQKKRSEEQPPAGTIAPAADKVAEPAPAATDASPPVAAPTVEPSAGHLDASAAPANPVAMAPPVGHPGRGKKIAGLVVAVTGLALIGVGAGMSALAASESDAVTHPQPGVPWDPSSDDRGHTYDATAIALYSIGGAAVMSGIVVAAVGFKQSRAQAFSVAPTVGKSSAGATLRMSF